MAGPDRKSRERVTGRFLDRTYVWGPLGLATTGYLIPQDSADDAVLCSWLLKLKYVFLVSAVVKVIVGEY